MITFYRDRSAQGVDALNAAGLRQTSAGAVRGAVEARGIYEFRREPHIPLLTVTRKGMWSLQTVAVYEAALRAELAKLQLTGRPTVFIIDIRSSGPQSKEVADALRAMVGRLGPLHAKRNAVVTSSGLAKLEARRKADDSARVFTSMVLARDWALAGAERTASHCATGYLTSATMNEGAG